MTFFSNSPNPLQTLMGQLIQRAINPHEPDARVEMFFEICDQINTREENAKDAFKVIRKELSIYKGKNWIVVRKILLLLETCTNNCNKKFQIHLANKEFLQELKSMIGPKYQPPLEIQEKVLYLIQLWNNMFKHDPEFKPIESFYKELREKGVDFPINTPSLDKLMEPISSEQFNESLKIGNEKSNQRTSPAKSQINQRSSQASYVTPNRPVGVIRLNDEQWGKLNSELSIVESNIQVFNEILNEVQSKQNKLFQENDQDISLMKEIFTTCKEMQKRITQLIGNISNEGVINELLRINDDLNNVFLRYERFERSIKINSDKKEQIVVTKKEEKPLIDFGDDNLDSKLTPSNLNINNNNSSKASDGLSFMEDENEIKEMENWLKSQEIVDKK